MADPVFLTITMSGEHFNLFFKNVKFFLRLPRRGISPRVNRVGGGSPPPDGPLGGGPQHCAMSVQEKRSAVSLRRLLRPLLPGPDRPLFGQFLVREGVISEDQLEIALECQRNDPRRLGRIIVEEGFASEMEILQAIAKTYGVSADSLDEDLSSRLGRRGRSLRSRLASFPMPIGAKLSIAITAIIAVTIVTLSLVILQRQRENLYRQAVSMGRVSLNFFVGAAAVPLLEDDMVSLNTLIRDATSVEGLLFASIADRERIVKAHTDTAMLGKRPPVPEMLGHESRDDDTVYFRARLPQRPHLLVLSRPVTFSGVELGWATVGLSLESIDRQIRKESLNVIVLSFFIILLGIAVSVKIGQNFSRPISRLVEATRQLGKGNLEHRIRETRRDEFGNLASAFNYMSRELWKKMKVQKSFGSYVSPEILEMILARPEDEWLRGRLMNVTVLFTDVRGFTAYSEGREPEQVVEAMNHYFQIAARCIQSHGGHVDKFIGDGVLGVFGAPVARQDHALGAVRAALAMQEEFRRSSDSERFFLSRIGIGIDTGEAVAGDLGSEVKKEYSVIGDCANLASRLSDLAGPGQTIISRRTLDAAGPTVTVRPLGPLTVKGKVGAVESFEVLGAVSGGE